MMVLIMVMAVMTGFQFTLREKLVSTNSHILVRKAGGMIARWQEVTEIIKSQNGVTSVSPYTQSQALISTDRGSVGVLIRGVAPKTDAADQLAKFMTKDGAHNNIEDLWTPGTVTVRDSAGVEQQATLPGMVIGRELQRTLGIFVGTPVAVLSPSVSSSPFGLLPRTRRFLVVGAYRSGLVEYESGVAYVSLTEAQSFFRLGESVTGLEVRVANLDSAPVIAREISEALGGGIAGYVVQDWTQSNEALWQAIELEKRAYFIVLLLIVIMASFSIISTLIMIVLEKRRDIAVLKTLGATDSAISRMFMVQGAVIGALGTVTGLILGYLGCIGLKHYGFPLDERVFQMSTLPIHIEPINFLIVGGCAFIICLLATIYPALRAARLEPIELLRNG